MSETRPTSGLNTNRIEAFSDGVFAVAITLLVLNLQVPELAASVVSQELVAKLIELWPKLLIYVLSFVIVGIYWVAHHNSFHYIKRSDRTLLWLNLLLLLCIVFIPFPTALVGEYPQQQISLVIYGGTLVITGLVLQLLWWYATSGYRLVEEATHSPDGDVGSPGEKEPPSSMSLKSDNLTERSNRNDAGRS